MIILDEWGSSVILFLRKDGDSYVPLSPQGVLTVEKSGYSPRADEPLKGKRILSEYNIANPQTNTKVDFEHIIIGSVPVMPTDVSASLPLNIRSGNVLGINASFTNIGIIAGVLVTCLAIIVILLLRHKGRILKH